MTSSSIRRSAVYAGVFGALLLGGMQAQALVVSGGSPTSAAPPNNTAPAGATDAWDRVQMQGNVNNIGNGSNVYLGSGWVLTAHHTGGKSQFHFEGDTYNAISGTGIRLTNPDDSSLTDLYMYRVAVNPGDPLAALGHIAIASEINLGDSGLMIGTGVTQVSLTSDTSYLGFDGYTTHNFDSPLVREKKWAANSISGFYNFDSDNMQSMDNAGDLNLHALMQVEFDIDTLNSGAATGGDSGSAFFAEISPGVFELAGIAHLIDSIDNDQPNHTRVDTNLSYYSNLTVYKAQIDAIRQGTIPEPATGLFALLGLPLIMQRTKRNS